MSKIKATANRVHFLALEVPTSSDCKFYVSVIPVSTLASVCAVSRAEEDPQKGYQRLLSKTRLKDIAEYLNSGKAIPGALILSAQKIADLHFDKKTGNISFLKHTKGFLVIDGQHRLFGAAESNHDVAFPVSIMAGLSLEEEVAYFNDINGEQKGVPRTLQLEIEKFLVPKESNEKIRIDLFHALNTRPDSPLCNRLSATKSVQGKLTHVPFKSALEPLLDQPPLAHMDFDTKLKTLVNFLKAVEFILLNSTKSAEKLSNAAFFQALFGAFKILSLLTYERHHDYSEEAFRDVLNPLQNINWEKYTGTNRQTIVAFSKHIENLIWK